MHAVCKKLSPFRKADECKEKAKELLVICKDLPCDKFLESVELPQHVREDAYVDCLGKRHSLLGFCTVLVQSWIKDCYENGRLDFPL